MMMMDKNSDQVAEVIQAATVNVLMALVLIWRPAGLFGKEQ